VSNPRVPFQLSTERPRLPPPDGKPLIVHIVVNVEHWQFDHAMPRKVVTPPHGVDNVPDVPNFSWAEYGMRMGMPRLIGLFAERGVPASCSFNAGVIDAYPACAAAIRDAGWEFIGHGVHQRAISGESDEGALIDLALGKIESFTGVRPRGWLGPGLRETFDTPDLLKAAGVDYVCDWVLDDLPCWMTTAHGPLIAMPYTVELNDSPIYAIQNHRSEEMHRRLTDTLECYEAELAEQPRVLTLALHPHLIAVPHRFPYLVRMLDLLLTRNDTVFMRGSDIADWFVAADHAATEGC